MQTILITGLLSVEKHELTADLAHYFRANGQTVAVIDNVVRLPMTESTLPADVSLARIAGTLTPDVIATPAADLVLVAASENAGPDALFTLALDLPDARSIALIDTRTCDCFPTLRSTLEAHADLTVSYPYDLHELIGTLKDHD